MIYECWDCGARFKEPVLHEERNEYGGFERREHFGRCPECGSENYDPRFGVGEDEESEE